MFEVGVVAEFDASHALKGDFGEASLLHSHTYKVEAKISGEMLDEWGVLFDIGGLKERLAQILQGLSGRNLNEIEVFSRENPTAENLSKYVFNEISPTISGKRPIRLKVTVWESENAFASYEE